RGCVGAVDVGRGLHPADAGDDASTRSVILIQAVRGERAQLQERGSGIEEVVDAISDRQLAALPMALDRGVVAPRAAVREIGLTPAQILDEGCHRLMVRARLPRGRGGAAP